MLKQIRRGTSTDLNWSRNGLQAKLEGNRGILTSATLAVMVTESFAATTPVKLARRMAINENSKGA